MLLNAKALKALGFTDWVISGIKRAGRVHGDSPFMGRYTTRKKLEAWFDIHPEFVASHYLRRPVSEERWEGQ